MGIGIGKATYTCIGMGIAIQFWEKYCIGIGNPEFQDWLKLWFFLPMICFDSL